MPGGQLLLTRAVLATIVLVYCLLGLAYAVETPKWQAPDEPAHYNYVVHLAEKGSFPVLKMGDYPHEYLEKIKAAGFPPDMSIEPIRYEFHQPPLYYLLATLPYRITGPLGFHAQFISLRLLSVALGAALLLVVYAIVREIFPGEVFLSLTTTAVVATVPMHIAMSAAINNDTLAELLLALVLWLCIKEIRAGLSRGQTVALGLLVALALLTKTTIYAPALLSALLALAIRAREGGWATTLRRLSLVYGLGLLLSSWWFLRNMRAYGHLDLFAWQRHDSVVIGQPTTSQWIAQYGLAKTVHDFLVVSFRSFWAQFGWMGALVDSRLYLLLGIFSAAVAAGFIIWLVGWARRRVTLHSFQRRSLSLLLLVFLVVAAGHISYNLKFVQHQGRYLFPALVPIALASALGLREWISIVTQLLYQLPFSSRVRRLLPVTLQGIFLSGFYLGFVVLDAVCLYLYIVPQLRG